jgi:hypothetical protein
MIPYERQWQQKQEEGGGDHNDDDDIVLFLVAFFCGGLLGGQCGVCCGSDVWFFIYIHNTVTYHPLKLSLKWPVLLTIYRRVDMLAFGGTVHFLVMNMTKQA